VYSTTFKQAPATVLPTRVTEKVTRDPAARVKPPLENAVENAPGVAVEFVDPIVIVGKAVYIDEPLTWISNCKEAPVGGVPTAHTGRLVSTVALGQYGIFNRAPTVKLEVSSLRLNISSA